MRKRLLSLILTQLNMNFGISHSRYYYLKKRERLWEPILIALSIGILATLLAIGIFVFASMYYDAAAALGQEGLTLMLGILLSQVIVLILGFVLVIAVFYFSNDLPVLIPLPFTPAEVLLGKFSVILANEYVGLAVFLIPLFIAYSAKAGTNTFAYWSTAIAIFLSLPIIPLAIAAIPAILLMRFTNLSRRKDALVMTGGFLFIILVVGFQIFIQTTAPAPGEESEFMRRVFSAANNLVDIVGRQFPPSIWATKAIAAAGTLSGLSYLILFLGISVLGIAVLLAIGNKVFYEGVLSGLEAGVRRKGKTAVNGISAARYREHSPCIALAITEARLFLRTPVFVLNGFAGFVIFPVMMVMAATVGKSGLEQLWKILYSVPDIGAVGALVVGAYFLVMAAMSSIPVTTFSREGMRNIWIPMSLPLSGRMVALGKALGAEWMIIPGVLPGVVAIEYVLRLPLWSLLVGTLIGMLASFSFCLWGVIIDMVRPMLNWNDPQKAVKSNLNTILGMLMGLVIAAILGFAAIEAFDAGFPGWAVVVAVMSVVVALSALTLRITGMIADHVWDAGITRF
ncbi:MAG TPA: hypothetical protein GX509_09920 [Firmicutes bacterium]|nr:hypothetical protein [Bacillota bacterium]